MSAIQLTYGKTNKVTLALNDKRDELELRVDIGDSKGQPIHLTKEQLHDLASGMSHIWEKMRSRGSDIPAF